MHQLAAIKEIQEKIALYEDMKAYSQLYEIFSDGLQRFSYSLVRSREVAEEIVSDVFIKLWQIRSRLMDIENLKVYLFTIAKNFSLNYLSRNYTSMVISLETLDIEPMIELHNPADLCISSDLVAQIRKLIRQLPPQCRLIFQLVKEEGLQYKEVAAILDISPLTVRNQLAIAVKKIGETLPAYLHSPVSLMDRFSPS